MYIIFKLVLFYIITIRKKVKVYDSLECVVNTFQEFQHVITKRYHK